MQSFTILFKSRTFKQFISFLFVGLINTTTGMSMIFFALIALKFNDLLANMFGYACGITISFILNSKWTFNHKGPTANTAYKFILAILIAYFINLSVVMAAIHLAHINNYIAHIIGSVPYTLITFLLSKYFVFR